MDTAKLKRFAQTARKQLMQQVSSKIELVLAEESAARRLYPESVKKLQERLQELGQDAVVDQVAYFWFNRFCALRFMDVNDYNDTRVVSPLNDASSLPAILDDAKQDIFDYELTPETVQTRVTGLLNGTETSLAPDLEAYKLLLVNACNHWALKMPFLFQSVNDYTELLLPDDLLSSGSVLVSLREAMTEEACESVEVIGWLYQYYISEKKDTVLQSARDKRYLSQDEIPAATQLFTPSWIVKYIVENSLGRLWMLNHPESNLRKNMEFYLDDVQPIEEFQQVNSPEEIKIMDPCCGSGHILVYAFDLLFKIYEEAGYAKNTIAAKILENNLFGVEIDERAGELAAFALTMKAREGSHNYFNKVVQPKILVLQNLDIEKQIKQKFHETKRNYLKEFKDELSELSSFSHIAEFGSLVKVSSKTSAFLKKVEEDLTLSLFDEQLGEDLQNVLSVGRYLGSSYDIVITNPPYVSSRVYSPNLNKFITNGYKRSKSNLYAAFIDRCLDLCKQNGFVSMVTLHGWSFTSVYQVLREHLLNEFSLVSLIDIGTRGFDEIGGEVVSTNSFTFHKNKPNGKLSRFLRLVDGNNEKEKITLFIENRDSGYQIDQKRFNAIPGSPIAYWVNDKIFEIFKNNKKLSEVCTLAQGLATADNNRFLRLWYEVSLDKIGFGLKSTADALASEKKWFPHNKGGEYRKWYGNQDYVVNWEYDGEEIKNFVDENGKQRSVVRNPDLYFKPSISWSDVTSGSNSFRYYPVGFTFNCVGMSIFSSNHLFMLAYLNSRFANFIAKMINPTIHLSTGCVANFPYISPYKDEDKIKIQRAIDISKKDFDSSEVSWDFCGYGDLLSKGLLKEKINKYFSDWNELTDELLQIENWNEEKIGGAVGEKSIQKLMLKDIALDNNPYMSIGDANEISKVRTQILLQQLISFAVGCMFGRYSIDKEGLILANQESTLDDYLEAVPNPRFMPDADNCIPICDDEWFTDDIVARFSEFVRIVFGEQHHSENMSLITSALNVKEKKNWTLRDYFATDFYADHVKRYRKRPIYWLFSSPKGGFKCLVYLHRINKGTPGTVLNTYLRALIRKLQSLIEATNRTLDNAQTSAREKTVAMKNKAKYQKVLEEIQAYEKNVLYPLAQEGIEIDLDDGVRVNYLKFGPALKKITGLAAKDE